MSVFVLIECIRIDEVLEPITPTSGGEVVIHRHELEAPADPDVAMTVAFVYWKEKLKSGEHVVVLRGEPSRTIRPGESLVIQTDQAELPITVLAAESVNQFDGSVEVHVKGLKHQVQIGDRLIGPTE